MPFCKQFFDSTESTPYVRELQLRREIVATMKLRAAKSCSNGLSAMLADYGPAVSRKESPAEDGTREKAARDAKGRLSSTPSPSHIHILAISDYEGLRTSRELVLRRYGYQVVSCGSYSVGSQLEAAGFQIAILCQSVDTVSARRLAFTLMSRNPALLILRIRPCRFDFEEGYDATMEAFENPDTLLQRVRFLAQRTVSL